MYRGIIQESAWVKGFLRERVLEAGLDKNVGRGRIWRVVSDMTKKTTAPRMLDETSTQLVAHLSHPNGWWRDTAQKLLVLKRDGAAAPALKQLARTGQAPLGRMHALWTLEGMDIIDRELLVEKFRDTDPRVRMAAVRISERLLRQGDEALLAKLEPLVSDPDPNVIAQVVLSAGFSTKKDPALALLAKTSMAKVAPDLLGACVKNSTARLNGVKDATLSKGAVIYQSLCFSCHGPDGKGMDAGTAKMAPSLAGSPIAVGDKTLMIKILLHGLTGPIEGKTYVGQIMVSMAQESDEWIANVLTEVRSSWGNTGDAVTPADVAKVRAATAGVKEAYTMDKLLGK